MKEDADCSRRYRGRPGLELWALLAADGSPIMLADSREAVVLNARENDLDP
jgi:hypothetical protein